MSELFHPNDEINEVPYMSENPLSPSLRPIDEAEDFYDPFSDLNLFLSRKIKEEIEESGSQKNWSKKIEVTLLAKILPEFKQIFPKYRLGRFALKKVWEKVAYYYERIQGQKGVFKKNGALNLKFMIRENLKSAAALSHLPPYVVAQQIAAKLSECIASLEGKKINLDHLTKIIWSVQKHLTCNVSSTQTKYPCEEYNYLDKLIVKTVLEVSARGENLESSILKKQVLESVKDYTRIQKLFKKSQLTSTLSMILAKKLYHSSLITCHFSSKERDAIEDFIQHQIEMGQSNTLLMNDAHRMELIQRILALYTIATSLPKNLTSHFLRDAIDHIKTLNQEKKGALTPHLDQGLFVFINAEIHLMDENKCYHGKGREAIVKAYEKACALPKMSASQLEQFELLVWKTIEDKEKLLSHLPFDTYHLIEKELGNVLIDNPKQSFQMIISHTLQFFKQVLATPLDQKTLEDQVEPWITQQDMLIRTIHFDPKTSLLRILEKEWKQRAFDEQTVDHEKFMALVKEKTIEKFPILSFFQEELNVRLWILYKYLWYNTLSDGKTSTHERFLLWHRLFLEHHHPEWTQKQVDQALVKLSHALLPLFPCEKTS